jgi:hypothetical protein
MYPSGTWRGFWEQKHYGRQAMTDFTLVFSAGRIAGSGTDIIGPFTVSGEYDTAGGRIAFAKQYLGRHRVDYTGRPDGEGTIHGTWRIESGGSVYEGPFALGPVGHRAAGSETIQEITR